MELIREIGVRETLSINGKTSKRKWGIFKCPSCGIEKEYNLQKGNTNKTCGSSGCRKTQATFNPWNGGMAIEDKLNSLPYYSTFSAYYQTLCARDGVSIIWKSLEEFRNDMYEAYKGLRDSGIARLSLCVTNDGVVTKSNSFWTGTGYSTIDEDEVVINGKYHSALLCNELLIPNEELSQLITELFPTKRREVVYGRNGSTLSFPNLYYTFTRDEYTKLRIKIRDAQLITSNNYLYLIRMVGTDFVKIGRATNVQNRIDDFNVGNPYELEVVYTAKMFNFGKIEQRVHKAVSEKKVKGEWFKLTEIEVANLIVTVEDMIVNP